MIRAKKSLFAAVAALVFSGNVLSQERELGLDALLSQADSGSVALREARSGVAAARDAADAADRAAWLPDLALSAAVGYLGDGHGWGRDSSYSFSVAMPHFSTRFGLEAQQVVYAGGALRSARRQARLGVRLEELGYEQQRQALRLQLVGHYLDLYRAVRQLEVLDSNLAVRRQSLLLDTENYTLVADRYQNALTARSAQGTTIRLWSVCATSSDSPS